MTNPHTEARRLRAEIARLRDKNAELTRKYEGLEFSYRHLCTILERYEMPDSFEVPA